MYHHYFLNSLWMLYTVRRATPHAFAVHSITLSWRVDLWWIFFIAWKMLAHFPQCTLRFVVANDLCLFFYSTFPVTWFKSTTNVAGTFLLMLLRHILSIYNILLQSLLVDRVYSPTAVLQVEWDSSAIWLYCKNPREGAPVHIVACLHATTGMHST